MTATLPDRDVIAGLLAALDPAVVARLTDGQIARLTDWSNDACVRVAQDEACRRDIAMMRAQLTEPARPGAWEPVQVGPVGDVPAVRRLTARESAELDFAAYAESAYVAAEAFTCGHMLSAVGRAAGTPERGLFRGPEAWARKHASWELNEWWDRHGRLTVTAFRQGMSPAGARDAREDLDYRESEGVTV